MDDTASVAVQQCRQQSLRCPQRRRQQFLEYSSVLFPADSLDNVTRIQDGISFEHYRKRLSWLVRLATTLALVFTLALMKALS
jgi:hypothetical protein